MFIPKKLKFQKVFKGRLKGSTTSGNKIIFGKFALKCLEETRITHLQLETSKKILLRNMKKTGTIWIRIFPHIPVTNKPNENRMGKGKGDVTNWIARVKKGQVIFELNGISFEFAKKVLHLSSKKLPIKTKFIYK